MLCAQVPILAKVLGPVLQHVTGRSAPARANPAHTFGLHRILDGVEALIAAKTAG